MTRAKLAILAIGGCAALAALVVYLTMPTEARRTVGEPVAGMVAIVNASSPAADIYNGQFCGGVLVASAVVLTAAHCVADRTPSQIDVVVGADNLCADAPIDGVRSAVREIDLHPSYDKTSGCFDLARLILAVPQAADVVRDRSGPAPGEPAIALGWGRMSPGGLAPCRLVQSEQRLLGPAECSAAADGPDRAFDPASMVCATPQGEGASDTCAGDSGGPLVGGADVRRGQVVGIVSWGRECGPQGVGVYARVDGWP